MRNLIVILLLGIQPIFGQPNDLLKKRIVFDQFNDHHSLSQNTINCVLQDSEGYLWIGTWSGLVRYDGYTTTVFHSENAPGKISSNKILTIYEDKEGFLWIGTHMGGLFRYDRRRNVFDQFAHDQQDDGSLDNNKVWAIQEDAKGNLWVGSENGLNILKKGASSFERINKANVPTLSDDFITDIHLSKAGDMWVATENGLNKVLVEEKNGNTNYSFQTFYYEEDQPSDHLHNYIYGINETEVNGKAVIWYSSKKGLKGLLPDGIKNFTVPGKPLSNSFFRSMLPIEGENPLIVMGSESGISFFNTATLRFEEGANTDPTAMGLSHNTVTSIFLDQGGVLWVGTKKGLNKYDSYTKDFEWFSTANFDNSKSIITGVQPAQGNGYWVSTIGGGIYKFDGRGSFQKCKIKSSDENDFTDFIQTLYADGKGDVWVGTAGAGVYHFKENEVDSKGNITTYKHYHTKSSLADDYVMSLAKDKDGGMIVGMWSGGLNRITALGKVEHLRHPLLSQAPIVVIYVDLKGTIWAGTRGNGLYKVSKNGENVDVEHFHRGSSDNTSISNNFINALYEDHAGLLWIGTDGGLNSIDRRTEEFTYHKLQGGPTNDVIVSILEDNQGKLWLAHWEGLSVIDPADPTWMRNYDRNDRIMGGFYYSNVCTKGREGQLLFAGSEGFNRIDTRRISSKPDMFPLVVTQFQLFGKPITLGQQVNGRTLLDEPLVNNTAITLKHDENSISFDFASLDYSAPEKIRYAYMLEGFDDVWNYTTSARRFANYTNLNNGNYTFKVKATSSDGVWQHTTTQLAITVLPPWWKTPWAIALYFVLLSAVLYFFRKMILLRANLLHNIKLERLERNNVEKLSKAKLQFFTNISHEFRTPLTLILGPAQGLLYAEDSTSTARNLAFTINNNAQRLLRLVNQLLDFRKAETGNLELHAAEGNLVRFVKEIKLSFDALAEQMRIQFSFEHSSNSIKAWFDPDHFEKILFNLLSNAFKHTPEGGAIAIKLVEIEDEIHLSVQDTGLGIKQEHFVDIFQSFFSYDEDKNHTGTGIGLALTKSLVDMHKGTIDVQSKEGEFTRFTIKLKKGSAHFDAAEISSKPSDLESLEYYHSLLDADLIIENIEKGKEEKVEEVAADAPKLLVVEDNDDVRSYIKSIFKNNYQLIEAADGALGLQLAEVEMPDLIISDVMMPNMDGITMCKKLKSDIKTSHIPVILLTARTSLIFKVEGLETGADDYVTKPFNPKVLELKVRNIIRTLVNMREMFSSGSALNIEPKRVMLTSADERFIESALESVEQHIADPDYSVETLGRDVGMSRMQLYRKLKAVTGLSANEFIRNMRLKRAAQLLEQNQLTVAEVTYMVGFSDLPYFRDCFKKMFGSTPSDYAQAAISKNVKST